MARKSSNAYVTLCFGECEYIGLHRVPICRLFAMAARKLAVC